MNINTTIMAQVTTFKCPWVTYHVMHTVEIIEIQVCEELYAVMTMEIIGDS